jgi:hypothetical protein
MRYLFVCQGIGHQFEPLFIYKEGRSNIYMILICDISSVGRAIPCQGIGHQFEPDMSLQITSLV